MLKFSVVVCVILWSGPAVAITWEFDDGTTQGWSAREAFLWGSTRETHLFPGEVEDGVWRIVVAPSVTKSFYPWPNVKLISPTIGYDSGLFDQVRIRFRTVHDRSTVGYFSFNMAWTNEHNAVEDPTRDQFVIVSQETLVYTTEWQEVGLSLVGQEEKTWEGLLKDIRLSFSLDGGDPSADPSAETVGWFEIDWIELTGEAELAQGELPLPHVEYFRFDEAGLFAPPVFYPLALGIGGGSGSDAAGVLTDLDGDGRLDLFAFFYHINYLQRNYTQGTSGGTGGKAGWLMALNDGQGALELGPIEVGATGDVSSLSNWFGLNVIGADLTGDGQDEIVIYDSRREMIEVWSIGPELQVEVLVQIEDRWPVAVADWDDDGRGELFVEEDWFFGEGSTSEIWDVEQGVWTYEEVEIDRTLLDMLQPMMLGAEGWGDFDGDGQMDFLSEFTRNPVEGDKGLVLKSWNAGDSLEVAEVFYDDRLFLRSSVMVRDLNADGVEDWVFIGGDHASGFGVFVEWGGGVYPTQEGERHRLQGSGTRVLSGDLDSDGDLDLVVLDPILGGVHVLKSSLGEQPTAVQTPTIVRPAQYRLGDSYPNPFNPQMVIPLDLVTDQKQVSLILYDVLGRRVRQLWQGPLQAGSHRFVWNGRDEAGKGVAAGVYIYKVEVDGQIEAKKTTKLP